MKPTLFSVMALTALSSVCLGGETIVLFDGKDTSAWKGYRQDAFPAKQWVVDNGALKTVPGNSLDLVTREKFKDFDLSFEWKVTPVGNSGVMYNVDEAGRAPWHSGPEYQVADDTKHPDGKNPKTSTASLYALRAPNDRKKLKPVGEWNESRIVSRRGKIEHWLNGEKVLEFDWNDPQLRADVKKAKFGEFATFMAKDEGHIVFQHHGEEVWYRNIRIKRL
jgi:hypothetical protein